MRCERRSVDEQTLFLALDVDGRERQAARDLGWREFGNDVGIPFPPGTEYLDEAFKNFEKYASSLLRQRAGLEPIPWQDALAVTLAALQPIQVSWHLVGSAALAVRGLDIVPGDIDLVTDAQGAHLMQQALRPHLIQPLVPTPGWVAESFTRTFPGACVEWVGGVNASADAPEPTDFGSIAASHLEQVTWNGYSIRVPPLDLQLSVNQRRGRTERAAQIERWMGHS